MRNIEKSLTSYVRGTGPRISDSDLCAYAKKDANKIINILFKIINDELEHTTGLESLERVRDLLKCISIVLANCEEVNRKIVSRRLHKLDEKIDRLKRENRNKFLNMENAYQELEKTRREMERVTEQTEEKESKQYDFISYLIDAIKNITYIEYTFNKMPSLVNVKDKEDHSLIQNIIVKYLDSVEENDEEDVLYYSNLISLILSQKSFSLNEKDKRKCLEEIYTAIDKLSIGKKEQKRNRKKIEWLQNLVDHLKGKEEQEAKIDQIANRYGISVFFDEDILDQARLVRMPKSGEMSDRQLVEEYVLTIDKESAIEIDDALSCRKLPNGNYLLGVHIASVLGYFPYDSIIVEEAISRSRSIYLPKKYQSKDNDFNRTVPIFPYDFSAKTASLIEGEPRLTRSYFYEISPSGEIVEERFLKTIIRSNKKATYQEVDKILKKGTEDEPLQETVKALQEVTEILDKRYTGTEIYEQIKESTDDFSDLKVNRVGAQKIVYLAMMLTGNRVASFFADPSRGYPCLYRVHEVNEENIKKIQAMVENLNRTYGGDQYKKLSSLIRGIYPNGWYDTEGSHYGLGLDHYCHCTSGLRRSADIVVEHGLEVCYDKTPTDKELEELEKEVAKRALEINSKQSPIDWFIKDYKRAYQRRR